MTDQPDKKRISDEVVLDFLDDNSETPYISTREQTRMKLAAETQERIIKPAVRVIIKDAFFSNTNPDALPDLTQATKEIAKGIVDAATPGNDPNKLNATIEAAITNLGIEVNNEQYKSFVNSFKPLFKEVNSAIMGKGVSGDGPQVS